MGDNNDFKPTVAAAVAATLGDAFTEGEDSSACTVSKQEMMKGFTELIVTLGVHPAMRAAVARKALVDKREATLDKELDTVDETSFRAARRVVLLGGA